VGTLERKHPYAKCEECPLREGATFVPSAGPEHAALAIVGEAPGIQEARGGTPFVGPSGKLLDVVLKHHGIRRDETFLSNACLCRPNDGGTPPKSAIAACRPRLIMELQGRGVETVVALGNSAAESILRKSGVTKLRVGPGHPGGDDLPGVRVIPTVHPAACLRQGDQFPHLVTDIGKVTYELPHWDPPQYVVADDVDSALALLDGIDERLTSGVGLVANPEKVLVIDIEVDIEKDTAYDHPNHYGMLCVGIGYDESKVVVLAEGVMGSEQVRRRLGLLLRRWKIVAQNGKFDLAGLYPLVGGLSLFFDTMLASYTFDERPGIHGLKHMAVEYLGAPQYDLEIQQYVGPGIGYGAIPRDLLYKYNAYDVACTYALYRMWSARYEQGNEDLRRVHDHLVRASNQLMYLELNGIAVDREELRRLDHAYVESLHVLEDKIDETIKPLGIDYMPKNYAGINPRSPMQVKKFLADNGINAASTDAETLQYILDRKSLPKNEEVVKDFVRLMLEHRGEAKMHGTYVKGIAKRLYRGRVYSTYSLHGTTTGRLASRNPNLQNVPRGDKIRRIFVPSVPDNIFLHTDYSQAELRVLSFLSGDVYFRDIFNEGIRDLFDELTPVLYPEANKATMTKEEWKELRIRVKAYVYGVSYGRSEFSIAQEFDIGVGVARQGMERFFEVIPEIVQFREQTRKLVLAGEDLVSPFGRHRRYALITKENVGNIMNEALAYLPQSTASDMCLQAMAWTREETKGIAWVRNIIHDAILLECHPDDAEEVQAITERNMIKSAKTIVGDHVKFAVETTTGKNWGEV
jgi:uracil-DNA glycosylase family 4